MIFKARFTLKALFAIVAIIAVICAYDADWIRKRHELLVVYDARGAYFQNHYECFTRSCEEGIRTTPRSTANLLWLFGEPNQKRATLWYQIVQKQSFNPNLHTQPFPSQKDIRQEELEQFERLFPESSFAS